MTSFRQKYYDLFSLVYDRFIALHSSDRQQNLRRHLAQLIPTTGKDKILDLCTGTGSLLPHLKLTGDSERVVIGIDFSSGMLKAARPKLRHLAKVFLVQGNASWLPFRDGVFDAVICSHAFYELKGQVQDMALKEIRRVLKKGGSFFMMEHDIPHNPILKGLFYIRLLSMGPRRATQILKHEKEFLLHYFHSVDRLSSPGGRSKIMICRG